MLLSPKKRIWPSLKARSCSNMRRHREGEIKGRSPSITSTSARACQNVLPSKTDYFLAGAAALLLLLFEPRMALKKSDDGSSTITSFFLLKLAL
jgi:hypothetical protein